MNIATTFVKYRYTFVDLIIYLLVATSSFMVLQWKGQDLFLILQIFFCLIMLCYYKKIVFHKDHLVNVIFIFMFITMFVAIVNNVQLSYVKAAIYATITMIPLYFSTSYLRTYLSNRANKWHVIRNAVKLMCLVQMIWFLFQFFAYRLFEVDLNQVVFVDSLHLLEKASFFKGGEVFMPTGLCWHPIIMAPILVLAYYIFSGIFIKLLVIFEALASGNSTVLIAVIVCIVLDLVCRVFRSIHRGKVKAFYIYFLLGVLVVGCFVLFFTPIGELLLSKISFVANRITGTGVVDGSTAAHIRYYTAYPDVLKISSVSQIFCGYGESCSGYPFGALFQQYTYLGNWAVESDIMNTLISRGIIGFILFYLLLVKIAVKGKRIDYRYTCFIITIIISGITYNVQFMWVLLVEFLLLISIEQNVNFFNCDTPMKSAIE